MTVRNDEVGRHPLNGRQRKGPRDGAHTRAGSPRARDGHRQKVFFLFSNRLGCLGSLLLSAILTLVLLFLLGVL